MMHFKLSALTLKFMEAGSQRVEEGSGLLAPRRLVDVD